MKYTQRTLILLFLAISLVLALFVMANAGLWISLHFYDGSFAKSVSEEEYQLRNDLISQARNWLDTQEGSDRHQEILDIYNSHEPLARGYVVTTEDNWCATFGSCIAIKEGLSDIVPTECGCERQIELWKELGRWTEYDAHMPLPGDYIYYNWNETWNLADNTGWADHVGIVVGTAGPMIKVIEGNKDDCVTYRVICRGDYRIRGYGLPDYTSIG